MTTIGVLARPDLVQAGATIRDLVTWLGEHGATPLLDEATAALAGPEAASASRVLSGREVADSADALVVLGGDGTLLAASRLLERAVPVLGVNFGSLGFLTEIALPELFPTLLGVLEKRYEFEERRLLHAVVTRRGHPDATGDVLNDVVITKAGPSRIIEMDVTVDGLFVSSFRADGLIVSSPTGSTAYSLSAGGPILHPGIAGWVLVPIASHTMSNRPIVLPDGGEVRITIVAGRDASANFDMQRLASLLHGDQVRMRRSAQKVRFLHPRGWSYFDTLRKKLHWNEGGS